MKTFKSTLLAVFAGCISFVTLADSQWYAKPDGADDAACTDPATAGSISAAMAKAAAADGASVITLADGDYDIAALTPVKENNSSAFFVVKKDLTLVSEGGDPANCRLIGGGEENRSRFLLIPSAASIALTGITVTNFWDSAEDKNYLGGGAIFANGTSVALTISGCVFADNHTRRPQWTSGISGGAINGGALDVTDTAFIGNMAITGSDETGSGGAFCSGASWADRSLVMTNFQGSFSDISTLAHELGHAWHNRCMKGLPFMMTDAPMPLAETASIFNETMLVNKLIELAFFLF